MVDVFDNFTLDVVLETDVAGSFVFIEIYSEIYENPCIKIVAAAFLEFFGRGLTGTVIFVVGVGIKVEISVFENRKGKHAVSESLVVEIFVLSWVVDREPKHEAILSFKIGIVEFEPTSD